ncbi:hypothetical protein Q4485_15825 [Granulosicoccaceae sp. 1_MG-2023]|nr:hypothetical protein [Granulosicoccaceae sp. 1_MG-2023]
MLKSVAFNASDSRYYYHRYLYFEDLLLCAVSLCLLQLLFRQAASYGIFDIGLNVRLNKQAHIKAAIYNVGDKQVTTESYGVVLDGRRLNLGLHVDF